MSGTLNPPWAASSSPALPNSDGLVGSTLSDLALITGANTTFTYVSGVIIANACTVWAPATRIAFEIDSPGTTLTAGKSFIGIYNAAGKLVMATGDLSTIMSSGGNQNVVVANLPSTLPPGNYFVATLVNYTGTSPHLAGIVCPVAPEAVSKLLIPGRITYSTAATYTSLPATINWVAAGFTANFWNFATWIGFLP